MSNEHKQTLFGIDIFKLLASVLVVLLHTVENNSWYPNEVKYVFTRFAVPFFFITSGFFFYRGLSRTFSPKEYFIKYEMHLIKLFLIWALIIYSPFLIINYIQKYPDAEIFQLVLLLIRRVFIIGPGPYWYLIASMWAVAFLYFCNHIKKDVLIDVAIICGLLLCFGYTCLNGILSQVEFFRLLFEAIYIIFSWEFNFIMYGIPFMGIGFLIAKNGWEMKRQTAILVFFISTFLRVVEFNLPMIFQSDFWNNNSISICYIIQALTFFMLAKNSGIVIPERISISVRQLSSCIYFSHAIIMYEILNPLLSYYTNLSVYADSMIPIKMIVVLIMCCIFYITIKKANNKHLNILING